MTNHYSQLSKICEYFIKNYFSFCIKEKIFEDSTSYFIGISHEHILISFHESTCHVCNHRGELNMLLKVAAGDPGKTDPFGFIGVEYDTQKDIIYIKYVKQWKKQSYETVGYDIAQICKRARPKILAIEANNDGKEAIRVFEEIYNLSITPINTSSNITNQKIKDKGFTMNKTEIVKWFLAMKRQHKIVFPIKKNSNLLELERQISQFTRYWTLGKKETYKASSSGHDDLVMALLLCCHIVKKFIETELINYA